MDEIAKEIQKTNIGMEIPGSNTKIGCLLWMDDVLLMADNEKDLQTLLNITVNTANKYHIVFGEEKSKIMIMNSKKELKNTMKMGNMTLKTTENYKYLGEKINHKKSMKYKISESKRKAEGAGTLWILWRTVHRFGLIWIIITVYVCRMPLIGLTRLVCGLLMHL